MPNTEQRLPGYMDAMRDQTVEELMAKIIAAEEREEKSLDTFAQRIKEASLATTKDSEE